MTFWPLCYGSEAISSKKLRAHNPGLSVHMDQDLGREKMN